MNSPSDQRRQPKSGVNVLIKIPRHSSRCATKSKWKLSLVSQAINLRPSHHHKPWVFRVSLTSITKTFTLIVLQVFLQCKLCYLRKNLVAEDWWARFDAAQLSVDLRSMPVSWLVAAELIAWSDFYSIPLGLPEPDAMDGSAHFQKSSAWPVAVIVPKSSTNCRRLSRRNER